MTLNNLLKQHQLTKYQLSNISLVPYSTICDLFNEKTNLNKSSVDVVYKIAKALNMTIDDLLESVMNETQPIRSDFETFKSNTKHLIHDTDALTFLEKTIRSDLVNVYFERKWFPEALYTLAMIDYLSRINNIPLYKKYDSLRKSKLKRIIYPASLLITSAVEKRSVLLKQYFSQSIEEFKRFNIVENELNNVA